MYGWKPANLERYFQEYKMQKKYKYSLLTGIVLAGIICLLAQFEFVRVVSSQLINNRTTPLPLGEGKTTSIEFVNFLEKPYRAYLLLELPREEAEKYSDGAIDKKYIDTLDMELICMRLSGKEKTVIYQQTYRGRESFKYQTEWASELDSEVFSNLFFSLARFTLPTGKYRCDFIDKSPETAKRQFPKAVVNVGAYKFYF